MGNRNTTNTQTCGIKQGAGSILKAKTVTIINNPSQAGTSATTGTARFRLNVLTPTRNFKGRRKTLADVLEYFINLPPQSVDFWERIVSIVGLPGMGKTETANKFAVEHKQFFPNVALVNAETEQSILASFLELAKHLGIVPQSTESANLNLVKEVYREIDRRVSGRVLLIFDNAIQLNSIGTEFGISEYLPTEDLPNGRFPYIIITTQTDYWERGIKKFLVDGLTEEESLEFFRSSFQVKTPECNEEFKKLHKILEGYPLVMNLVITQIDYIPTKDSMNHLKRQISNYIDKLENDQDKMLRENTSRACPIAYNKTLSNVLLLTFERIQQENKGREALELLQMMSFLHVPIVSDDVVKMLVRSSDCPHPPEKESQFKVKELLRVLERFYTTRILEKDEDEQYLFYDYEEEGFRCHLRIHRLVQFVVRQQIDSSKVLERMLIYFASEYEVNKSLNKSALEEALCRIQLSQRALPYLGILACQGLPAARKMVETTQPESMAAETIWRLYNLERGMTTLNENATQALHELIGLTKSEEPIEARFFFGEIAVRLLTDNKYLVHEKDDETEAPGYFDLDSLDVNTQGMEQLYNQLILNLSSIQDLSCKSYYCKRGLKSRDSLLSRLTAKLPETINQADAPNSTLTVDAIAHIWFALLEKRMDFGHADREKNLSDFRLNFGRDTRWAFHSPNRSESIFGRLKRWSRTRVKAKELILTSAIFTFKLIVNGISPTISLAILIGSIYFKDLSEKSVQGILSSICRMAATFEAEFVSKDYLDVPDCYKDFAVEFCSFWIRLLLIPGGLLSLGEFLNSLSQLKFLDWMERSPKDFFGLSARALPEEYRSEYFPQFIRKFSWWSGKPIKTLVNVCRRVMEDYELFEHELVRAANSEPSNDRRGLQGGPEPLQETLGSISLATLQSDYRDLLMDSRLYIRQPSTEISSATDHQRPGQAEAFNLV